MFLLSKRYFWRTAAVLGLLVVVAILGAHRGDITHDFFRQFPPSDFGFSSQKQITTQCEGSCINTVFRGLIHKVLSVFDTQQPEVLRLHIPFKAMQTLLDDQQKSIARNRLTPDRTWVKSRVEHEGLFYPARVRLKGELNDHWSEIGRMSLRVDARKGKTIMGFSSFALQKPESRQYPYEPAYEELVKNLGDLATNYKIVDLSVNGERWGLWIMEERISSEFLEKQRRKDSLVFNLSNDHYWHYAKDSKGSTYSSPSYRMKDVRLFADVYGRGGIRRNIVKRRQYSYVMNQLLNDGGSETYDWDAFSRSIALAFLWGTNHVLLGGNTRYYLNPYTLLLEPISSDQSWPNPVRRSNLVYPYALPFRRLVEDDSFPERFQHALKTVERQGPELMPVFSSLYSTFPNDSHYSPARIVRENLQLARKSGVEVIQFLHPRLPLNRGYFPNSEKAKLPTEEQIAHLKHHVYIRHYADGVLQIFNLLPISVSLLDVRTNFDRIEDQFPPIPASSVVTLNTGWTGLQDDEIEVVTQVDGHERVEKSGLTLLPIQKAGNPIFDFVDHASMPSFVKRSGAGYQIKKGDWQIRDPLVLDGPLTIAAGTRLQFGRDAYLIIHGALHARANGDQPIILEATEKTWRGLYVFKSDERSHLSHVTIKNTSALVVDALNLTGGVTFYQSDVEAMNVNFIGSQAEDGLNVVESDLILKNAHFENMRSDALDLDFCTGEISALAFQNIGGDGLDVSGTQISASGVLAKDVRDKAISVGEASQLSISDVHLDRVGV